jgi:hypothetical protein
MFALSALVYPKAATAQGDVTWYALEITNEQDLPDCVLRSYPLAETSADFLKVYTNCSDSVTLEVLECTKIQCSDSSVTLDPGNRKEESHIITSKDLGLPARGVDLGTESTLTLGWAYRDSEGVIEISMVRRRFSGGHDAIGYCNHLPSSGGAPALPAVLVILAVGCTVRSRS